MIELIQPIPGYQLNPIINCGDDGGTRVENINRLERSWRTDLKKGYVIANIPYLNHYKESITPACGTRDKFPVDTRQFLIESHFVMSSLSPVGALHNPVEKILLDIDFRLDNIRTAVDLRVYFRGRIAVELRTPNGSATLYAAREYRSAALPYIGEEALTVPGNLPGGVADFHRCLAIEIPRGILPVAGQVFDATLTIKYYDFLKGIDPADGPFVKLSDTSQASGLDWLGIKRVYAHHFVDIV